MIKGFGISQTLFIFIKSVDDESNTQKCPSKQSILHKKCDNHSF